MKKLLFFVIHLFVIASVYSQVPNQFKYQALFRDVDGNILSNQEVSVNIKILQGAVNGLSVFEEIHNLTTTSQGIINLNIGSINDLSVVDWSSDIYFVEVSVNGFVMGTSQLLSVPYALHAISADNVDDADSDPFNELQNLSLNGNILEINDGLGVDLSIVQDGTGTDDQLLDLIGNGLSIEDGNTIDLSLYMDNTDNQELNIADNQLSIENGNIVDLSVFLDNSDEQDLSLNGTILGISNGTSADLSSLQDGTGTDNQILSITDNSLSIEGGNSVNLIQYIDNTDEQDLSLNGTILEISNGLSADLSSLQDGTGTDNQTLSDVLTVGNDAGNNSIINLESPVNENDAATKAYVDLIRTELIAMIGVTDVDGNHYPAISIGNQIWMAKNLKVTRYANGLPIPLITDNTNWGNLADNNTADAYCFYNNNSNSEYGGLYTWAAAMNKNNSSNSNPSGVQGVCPDGWHLPSSNEWQELFDYLGGALISGGKMKEIGLAHWDSPNSGADNESGFKAIPGGYRNQSTGEFSREGLYCYLWSSTDNGGTYGWYHYLSFDNAAIGNHSDPKSNGMSVRCVKD